MPGTPGRTKKNKQNKKDKEMNKKENEAAVAVKKDIGTQVIDRVNSLCEAGFTMPKGYNHINAIKSSMLAISEVGNDGRSMLDQCTPHSVQTALFEMCTKGLDVSRKTAYFIVRGGKLTLHVSYFGNILQVRRMYPNWSPTAHTIHEGDDFVYTIDPETGKMALVRHTQRLENLDNDILGAYMYLPCPDGTQELYVMTKKQIVAAWSQSRNSSLSTHKKFPEKMALKTLINSGCTKVINTHPDAFSTPADDSSAPDADPQQYPQDEDFSDFEEVREETASQETDAPAADAPDEAKDGAMPEEYEI